MIGEGAHEAAVGLILLEGIRGLSHAYLIIPYVRTGLGVLSNMAQSGMVFEGHDYLSTSA